MPQGQIAQFLLALPLLLISLVLHELAHGVVANWLGDPTPKLHGRLTLNPIPHLDLWGSLALVITFLGSQGTFFFGWAKPVPIAPWHFKDPQRGMMLVGLAGPATNWALALVSAGCIWLTYTRSALLTRVLFELFLLNVLLGTLNLLPIPPLDGSRVVGGFLPRNAYREWIKLDRFGNYVFLGLIAVMLVAPGVYSATMGAVLNGAITLLLPG